jgi:beta-galactosidase/beta-glucuronidase
MKFNTVLLLCLAIGTTTLAQSSAWKMVEGRIATPWAEHVNPGQVHAEYPRPQLVRDTWMNLNGLWDYSIRPASTSKPDAYDGQILVPFAVESALSGVGKPVGIDNVLFYKRTFTLPSSFRGKTVVLHFGAVDWLAEVWVNGTKAGEHQGGYDPFSFDISGLLKSSGPQEVIVRVWDPSDDGPQPRGKQVKKPGSIWYTSVTGIWQTVWLEAVPKTHITKTKQTPDIDRNTLTVQATVQHLQPDDRLRVTAFEGSRKLAEQEVRASEQAVLTIANPMLWTPDNPQLYDVQIAVVRKGKVIDQVKSYFAMRKISMASDKNGVQRMLLNNQFLFQYGPLDQGWWPDGLYTAPSDEALKFDIEKTKAMGFNMIRKHVKVEPARWYYHCDKLGMLVWQDMPSGDMGNRWESRPGIIGIGTERERSPESEQIFRTEWKAILDANYNFPSIVVWVPFNEAWGQFKTEEITSWTMEYDPSRLVNSASGGNFHDAGHIMDFHNYPDPGIPDPKLYGAKQIIALGEYGGLGLPIEGHTWQEKNNWGYQSFSTREELQRKYESFINRFDNLIRLGMSAAVYTQTTDVEIETNGLMTYDRKVIKMPEEKLNQLHRPLYTLRIE